MQVLWVAGKRLPIFTGSALEMLDLQASVPLRGKWNIYKTSWRHYQKFFDHADPGYMSYVLIAGDIELIRFNSARTPVLNAFVIVQDDHLMKFKGVTWKKWEGSRNEKDLAL